MLLKKKRAASHEAAGGDDWNDFAFTADLFFIFFPGVRWNNNSVFGD